MSKTIQQYLNEIDYNFKDYQPSKEAIQFGLFIKMINGGKEENDTPLVHCLMLDKMINNNSRVAIMASRGLAKSSLIEYLVLYLACFEELGSIQKPTFIMYVADSIENGVKRFRSSLELKYANSSFLQEVIPNKSIKLLATDSKSNKEFELSDNDINDLSNAGRSITDVKITFINKNGTPLCIRNYGIKTGIRGTREFNTRPTCCHKKGTMIFSNEGYHKVEDYSYKASNRIEKGIEVELHGLINSETVTKEHRYMVSSLIKTIKKSNLVPQTNKKISMKGLTKTTSKYDYITPRWVEAQDLCVNKLLGNQKYRKDYIVKPIDYSIRNPEPFLYPKTIISKRNKKGQIVKHKIEYIPKLHKHISQPSFWYLYGLYLSDGTATKNKITFTFDIKKPKLINIFLEHCKKLGYTPNYHKCKTNCCTYSINDTPLAKYHNSNHLGNSIKFLPEWVLYQPLELQKQLLLGYIAGDGYIDYKRNQIRINSVNEDMINKLGFIAERLNLPYHIRWARKKCFMQCIKGYDKFITSNKQWEIRFSQNVKEVLDINIQSISSKKVFIKDNYLYRKIRNIRLKETENIFIPIQTPSHTYLTQFGLSHNCFIDDILKEEDARSETILSSIDNIIYQSIPYALHPTKQKIIWVGTPFNESDPLYKSIESGRWDSLVLPICEKFPCSEEEFRGAWEDRFSYNVVNNFYQDALAKGNANGFYQELMMSVISDDQLLIKKENIIWLDNKTLEKVNTKMFNYYITTDFAFSEKTSADYSVISVWAYTNNQDFILVDGVCAKQTIDLSIKDLFRLVSKYRPLQVGIEVTGQQGGFVKWIMEEQIRNQIYFSIKEIRPSKDKFSRFLAFSTMYHRNKVKVYSGIKQNEPYYNEYLNEISKVTKNGFKSKHDDVLDTNSMLLDLDLYAPSYSSNNMPTLVVQGEGSDYYWKNSKEPNIDRISYYF